MAFINSRTYQNLLSAYEVELTLSAKYLIYADIARSDGYMEIGNIYDITSRNNKEHARIWLRGIYEGSLPSLTDTLQEAARSELELANTTYQNYAAIAREEGYTDVAALFSGVANIDYNHSTYLRETYDNVIREEVFCKPQSTLWICMQCGNIMSEECAPNICPVCGFPQGYYRLYNPSNYYT